MSTSSFIPSSGQGAAGPLIAGAIRELSYGMRGEDVKHLQRLLNGCLMPSPGLVVDGIFGYKTELAVLRFQAGVAGLAIDAIVGPKTWAAINAAAPRHNEQLSVKKVDAKAPGTKANGGGVTRIHKPGNSKPEGGGNPVMSHGVVHMPEVIRRGGRLVPHYWQSDPKWGACQVNGGASLACIGCAVTSIAMVLKYYGRNVDPGTLNQWLIQNGGYSGSAVNWYAAFQAFGNQGQPIALHNPMFTDRRQFRSILYRRIEKQVPTIVDIDYGRDGDSTGNHYVVIVGRNGDGSLLMNDPAASSGNGASHSSDTQNHVEKTTRGGGYRIVSLCIANPA